MNTDSEMQRIVNNTKIIVEAIDAHKLAYNKGGKIEILLWFWTMCARDINILDVEQPCELVEKILHIIHSALNESSDLEEFIDEHYNIYEQRVAIYQDINKWSERLRMLCQWARHNNYIDGVENGSVQLDVRNLGDALESFEVESRLQDFMKRAIADISKNMTQYLVDYLQTLYPEVTANVAHVSLKKTVTMQPKEIVCKPFNPEEKAKPLSTASSKADRKNKGLWTSIQRLIASPMFKPLLLFGFLVNSTALLIGIYVELRDISDDLQGIRYDVSSIEYETDDMRERLRDLKENSDYLDGIYERQSNLSELYDIEEHLKTLTDYEPLLERIEAAFERIEENMKQALEYHTDKLIEQLLDGLNPPKFETRY